MTNSDKILWLLDDLRIEGDHQVSEQTLRMRFSGSLGSEEDLQEGIAALEASGVLERIGDRRDAFRRIS